jgi:type I restriction enzyme M protein
MLTPELQAKIRELWNRFWAGGIANPLSAIEQISYLIFIRRLEELDNQEATEATRDGRPFASRFADCEECRWSYIKAQSPERMLSLVRDEVFPFVKHLQLDGKAFAAAMKDAVFIIPKASLMASAVQLIDSLPLSDQNYDVQGDLYEELLSELNLAGKNGQFRTPRHIIRTMVELTDPILEDWICDPAAGTAGFLVAAYQWILKKYTPQDVVAVDPDGSWRHLTGQLLNDDPQEQAMLRGHRLVGYDFDQTMVRLGLMNMMLHGIQDPELRYQDTLSASFSPTRRYGVILANPPFTGNIDKADINQELLRLPTTKTELLFIELCVSLLAPGGRCAIIVPEGVLFNSTRAHKELRSELLENNQIRAVISLPGGCFKPYAGVKTAILLVQKGGTTERVWFYEVTGDGYTLDDRRMPDPARNNLQYVPQAYRILAKGSTEPWTSDGAAEISRDHSWTATLEEIAARDFSLSANLYRPYRATDQQVEDPAHILRRLRALDEQIQLRLSRIEAAISESTDA